MKFKVEIVVSIISRESTDTPPKEIKSSDFWQDETMEKIFLRFEEVQRRKRYLNNYYVSFANAEVTKLYLQWWNSLTKSKQLDIYYGGGVVD